MNNTVGIFFPESTKFIDLYPLEENGYFAPETRAIAFCMHATGVDSLFTKEDYNEFILRLAIIFQQLKVVEAFFSQDFLFNFNSDNNYHQITPQDLINHIGIHVHNVPSRPVPLDLWVKDLKKYWRDAIVISLFYNLVNPGKELVEEQETEENVKIGFDKVNMTPTENIIKNANILAKTVIKELPDQIFIQFQSTNFDYLGEIKKHLDFINSEPPIFFDWTRFPFNTQQTILKHLFPDEFREGITLDEMQEEFWGFTTDLIYLAWLFANGFVYDGNTCDVDPRFKFDISAFEGIEEMGGVNLQSLYDMYDFDSVVPLLKEIG